MHFYIIEQHNKSDFFPSKNLLKKKKDICWKAMYIPSFPHTFFGRQTFNPVQNYKNAEIGG